MWALCCMGDQEVNLTTFSFCCPTSDNGQKEVQPFLH